MTDDLGKYLWVPILHKKVNRDTFRYIIDRVDQRLSSWKANNLSMAGRVSFIKSVLQSLLIHVMQSTLLPKSICDDINKKCRDFVWGDSDRATPENPYCCVGSFV